MGPCTEREEQRARVDPEGTLRELSDLIIKELRKELLGNLLTS